MSAVLDQQIEAILFYKAEPMRYAELAELLSESEDAIKAGCNTLHNRLNDSSLCLIATETEVALGVDASFDAILETVRADELSRSLGRAGAETLAIILYRGPVTRSEIDRIRGVNSTHTLRTLSARGLIEHHSNNNRTEYRATAKLLAHLGVERVDALPEYHDILAAIERFENQTEI